MMLEETLDYSDGEINISFGYHCIPQDHDDDDDDSCSNRANCIDIPPAGKLRRVSRSFSCLSGAALSANATLANTNIRKGLIGEEILPTLDSPKSFRRIPSSPSLTKLDLLSTSLQSNMSNLCFSPPSPANTMLDCDSFALNSLSAPPRSESFLNATEVQVAGGAAGEDRVQAVCSEENGWLFCAIYDGFNGRDAADFLAGTLYETVTFHLNSLDWDLEQEPSSETASNDVSIDCFDSTDAKGDHRSFRQSVLNSLQSALKQTEDEFLEMVEQEMEERPDLVSIGSCVLLILLHGTNLYSMNVGDSRAVLATYGEGESQGLQAVQLTDIHTVDNDAERIQLLKDHPDDPYTIVAGKVKGKLKVTRAFGVGYLKKRCLNDALMGILCVRNLISPPYVSLEPSVKVHEVSDNDHFVVLGSDGLFDFFSNEEVVKLVHSYTSMNPFGDPAKYLVEQLAARAADSAGFSMDELMNIPAGRRRKYHDDVTVIVIVLGTNNRTSKASTCL